MSDKSFGDYANRNIVKNPLLSTAVTGLSIEDLTHNAVLMPVNPNQGQITSSDTVTYSQTLGNTEHDHTYFPSGDSNSNILSAHPPISSHSYNLDDKIGHQHDKKEDLLNTTLSKASIKTEDDFDVNEYFARLHGTRYVSAPLHSHPDSNANLTETEENLEEINLNDDKTSEVQQSLTADIAQNFSQLPNVLPHVASAVFSSFSNMWSAKSREQTPDDRAHSYQDVQFQASQNPNQFQSIQGSQKYEDVQFQGTPESNQFQSQSQGFTSNISSMPLLKTEDVVKEVAPPPKEPPICGTSNFRMTAARKKYAQIPGLSSGESRQIAFNPMTQNVPSYFIPTDFPGPEEHKETKTIECSSDTREPITKDNSENYNIFTPLPDTTTEEISNPVHAFNPNSNLPKPLEETPPPINLQNQIPEIPPPPMFSTQRKEHPLGKSILPPSVARRIGSNHPVMKQKIVKPPPTENIFVPTFDSTPTLESNISSDNAATPTYNTQMFATNINLHSQPFQQEIIGAWPTNLPAQISQQPLVIPQTAPPMSNPPSSTIIFPSQPDPHPNNVLPENKTAPYIFESIKQTVAPSIFTPGISDSTSDVVSPPPSSGIFSSPPELTSFPPPTNAFSPHPSIPQSTSIYPVPTTVDSHIVHNPSLFTMPTTSHAAEEQPLSHPPKALVEPPKVMGSSNFRMTKKRPQYYSGPIEGFGSISNNVKPIIPTIDSGSFQGALFTPEHIQQETNAPSFDINKPTESAGATEHFDVNPIGSPGSNFTVPPILNQESTFTNFNTTPYEDYGQQYNNPYDLSRPTTQNYEPKEEIKESKGFGIIGSLKSKLSNIDINKIQSSVTTFFDPGYNNTKKDNFVAQENIPHNPTQYQAQPQSNIDIFVPNIEPSTPYSSSSQIYQNIYSQGNYDNSSEYHIQQQNPPFIDHNYSNQTYSTNYYDQQTQNQQYISNMFSQGNTAEIIPSNVVKSEGNTSIPNKIEMITSSSNINYPQTEVASANQTDNYSEISSLLLHDVINEENTSDLKSIPEAVMESKLYESEPSLTMENIESPSRLSNIIPCPGEYKDTIVDHSLYEPPLDIAVPKSLVENSSIFYPDRVFEENQNNIPKQTFPVDTKSINQPVTSSITVHDIQEKEENKKKDNLLEALSKEDIPILSVSAVPLFGLSTIIADKAKESNEQNFGIGLPLYERIGNKNIADRNASISFFDHVDQKTLGHGVFNKSNTLNLKDEEYRTQTTSASYFTNDVPEDYGNTKESDVIVGGDRKETREINFENVGAKAGDFDLNDKTVLVKNEKVEYFQDSYKQENTENVSELNICETCREVDKPDEKDIERDDVTTQLIENITSPIQLSNPVEVPFTEDNSTERVEFDVEQFEEISHITEETIDTINVQSVVELLEDDSIKSMNYGWKTDEDYTSNPLKPYDYAFQADHNAIGFYGDSPLNDKVLSNASDELKADFRLQDVILPRQMSIPSAPPAEEDSKFDESGILDVNSIELDAKEDFSVYEEFVIEPSETDNQSEFKERKKTEENDLDSFTNRVEKFKKMEEVADAEENKQVLKLQDSPNQPISMASYFDTGNYAAETHYRNILISPSNITVPPGFEEEFKKRLALGKEETLTKTVPDTQTQTKSTVSVTTAQSIMPLGFNIVSNFTETVVTDTLFETPLFVPESMKSKESSSIFDFQDSKPTSNYGPFDMMKQSSEIASKDLKRDTIPGRSISPIGSGVVQLHEASLILKPGAVEMQKASSIFGFQGLIPETSNIFSSNKPKMPEPSLLFPPSNSGINANETKTTENKTAAPLLPDPINFFGDSTPQALSENNNRLASYFSSPPKTEQAKSFFELSQSQNHYKHSTISQNYEGLIKDLTSVQNLAVPTDQTIRHVNYFTVEYDVVPEFNKGDNTADVLIETDDKDLESLNHCSYCTALIYEKRYKVKASMNNNTEDRNSEPSMETTNSQPRNCVTVNFDGIPLSEETNEGVIQTEHRSSPEYGPVKHHWFYRVDVEDKSIWRGFSVQDSRALEISFLSPDLNENTLVPTDGGRYDVNLMGRLRIPVYWSDKPTNVRRCSWFYKGTTDPRYVPYTETVAEKLEEEYWHGISTGEWHRRLVLPNGEVVVMHGPNVMVHFLHSDAFSTPPQSSSRPRVVRRGHDDSEIEDAEPSSIDHLLLLCHGVGSACDMRFRSVEEVVEDFRATSLQLVQSHYKNSYDQGIVNRVEVLPISWHAALHSGETGVDRRLSQITLDSIPRLRNFTNDTVLDVLFYTSPVFCQTILNTVCQELNRIYQLFKKRNPSFEGGVSLGGHSLGSVILYDLLCHQVEENDRRDSQDKQYVSGPAGTGKPGVLYPRLEFEPAALYALGSPIAIFECIRGVESLGANFSLPTCKNFFNIFHPYDPIAYRIEPLINARLKELKPYLIPHHKGRKRMHLELKDTMARVGADLKQKLVESLRSTWNKWKSTPTDGALERVVEEDLEREQLFENKEALAKERELSTPEMLGRLNGGRRVDYVLQEAPLEMINEYLFAMSSHVGYWESEDTMLLMLREIYSDLGVQPDSTVPQQSMSVQRTRKLEGHCPDSDSPSTSGSGI